MTPHDTPDQKPVFKGMGWSPQNPIKAPPQGFRYVYADEVYMGSPTFVEMQK